MKPPKNTLSIFSFAGLKHVLCAFSLFFAHNVRQRKLSNGVETCTRTHQTVCTHIDTRSTGRRAGNQADRRAMQDISLKIANGIFAPGCLIEFDARSTCECGMNAMAWKNKPYVCITTQFQVHLGNG